MKSIYSNTTDRFSENRAVKNNWWWQQSCHVHECLNLNSYWIKFLTFTNILPTEERALLGVQYTDMDFLSLENSSVNSFFISCLIT